MNRADIIELIRELDVKNVKFAVTDIDGVLRGKIISTQKFQKAIIDDIGFCNVIFGWDINDQCYTNSKVSGWHTGYPDEFATIDPDSYRRIPWEDGKPFFLGDFSSSANLKGVCPRSVLKELHAEALKLGFLPKFSAEFEWYNFAETPNSFKEKQYLNPTPITPGMFGYSVLRASQNSGYINQLFNDLHTFGIPIEGLHTETGDGVYEAAITYTDILAAADQAALFKSSVKEIASLHGYIASFMAKWNPILPGCSGHLHQSLWNEEGDNLFYDENSDHHMSETMRQYLAGLLHCLPVLMPIFAPTINSYKRYVEGSWAPTSVSWGVENRTTALRVINNNAGSMRIENRVPGADTNPYLTMAASLAAGLYGIKNKLKLHTERTVGNEYEKADAIKLPNTLEEAVAKMKSSTLAAELLGIEFIDHFVRTREWEIAQFDSTQPNWEMKRYFEIV
jgi:glutamine synthetase